jgi:hydrogenase maturation protein HypF
MGAVFLNEAFGKEFLNLPIDFVKRLDPSRWQILERMISGKINCPEICSAGRVFDAVSAIVLGSDHQSFEGQAAIELEMCAEAETSNAYEFEAIESGDTFSFDPLPVVRGVVDDLTRGVSKSGIAGAFHQTIAAMVVEGCSRVRTMYGINRVVLSGGCFQNMLLLERCTDILTGMGFIVYSHRQVPPNDGGLSLGQILIASNQRG